MNQCFSDRMSENRARGRLNNLSLRLPTPGRRPESAETAPLRDDAEIADQE